jgi:hypothetical protein
MSGRILRIIVLLTIFVCFWGGVDLTPDASEAGEVSIMDPRNWTTE